MKFLRTFGTCIGVAAASAALGQAIQPVWMQHINGLVNVLPENKFPVLVKAGGTSALTYQFNGRDVVDSYVNFVRYDENLYLIGVRENGINENDPSLTQTQKDLAAAYPDRSIFWIDAKTGKSLGLAHKTEINPVPLAAQPAVYAWWRWGITDGPHGEKVIYTGYRYKILRYAPTGTVTDPAFPAGRATWAATPTEAWVEPVPGEPSGDESSGGDGSASWRFRAFRVKGHGPTTQVLAGGGTWRASHHPQEFVLDESGVKLRPISRMDDRNNGGEKGSYALGGISSSYVGHPTDAARPGLKVAYQGHYPATGWEARPNRYTKNPGGDGTAPRLGGTGRPDFFDLDEAAGGNLPAFAWESAGANGIPIKHAVDGVEHYDGNWVMTLDAAEGRDYIVSYAIPSWNQQFGRAGAAGAVFKPGWLGVHTLDGKIASGSSSVKLPFTEIDEPIVGNNGTGHDYVYEGDVSIYPVPGSPSKSLVLSAFGSNGFGVFEVDNVPASIVAAPVSVTVDENRPAMLMADVAGSPNKYRWAKDGVDLEADAAFEKGLFSGVDKSKLMIVSAQVTNAGSYVLKITNPAGSLQTVPVTLTVVQDRVAPTLKSVAGGRSPSSSYVNVEFSEPVTAATAGVAANYGLSGGATVTGVSILSATKVSLVTSPLTASSSYTVTVNGVKDVSASGNTIAAGSQMAFVAPGRIPGIALWEQYTGLERTGIDGTAVDALFGDGSYPDYPSRREFVTAFTTSPGLNNVADRFGGRLSAWITPTESGQYRFFIRSDDASQLWVSTDSTAENATLVAQETGCCRAFLEPTDAEGNRNEPTSDAIQLTAGTAYYIAAIYKEGGGGDFVEVAWRKEGSTVAAAQLTPIPGAVLSAFALANLEFTAVTLSGANVSVTWTGGGRLQTSTGLTGWTDVSGSPSSPYVAPVSGSEQRFYRLVR
jgi:hypothetical protein